MRILRSLLLAAASLAVGASPAGAALTFTAPQRLPHGDPAQHPFYGGGEPSIAFDPSGDGHVYVVAPQASPRGARPTTAPRGRRSPTPARPRAAATATSRCPATTPSPPPTSRPPRRRSARRPTWASRPPTATAAWQRTSRAGRTTASG